MSYPTVLGRAVEGTPFREARSDLGTAFANSTYKFFLSGTSTPANVYQAGAPATPFSPTGVVTSDAFGRFPAIYLDTSVIYKVQFFDQTSTLRWTVDPYTPPLATVGTSSLSAFGMTIAPTGEITIPAPNTGGSGISLTLKAGALGSSPLQINGTLPGNSALIVNSSATTGAQTATFVAANKPGTATSSPAGWLPITCDGVQYYAPIWHGNNFTPYAASPTALGEVINASSVTFTGNGLTTVVNGTATPSNWYTPVFTNVGAGYYINITKTGGLSGLAFSAAQGSWTNIGGGAGLTVSSNAQATITGTYQLSTSVSGSPVVANGTITLANNNGVQQPAYSGTTPFVLAGNGTATFNSVGTTNWFLPTTINTGSGYWVLITPTGGTGGYSFSVGTGAYTNITNGGLTINLSGSGGSGVPFVTGTYIIASDSGGVNQLGAGTIRLSGSLTRSYTAVVTNATETVPAGASFVTISVYGAGGSGGSVASGTNNGGGGGGGGYAVSAAVAVSAGQTLKYTVGAAGASSGPGPAPGHAGTASIVTGSGGLSGVSITANGGQPGNNGTGGAGGTASGGNATNTAGQAGANSAGGGNGGNNGAGTGGGNPGGGNPGGGSQGQSNNSASPVGGGGQIIFVYT